MNLNEKNKLRRLKLAQKNPEQRREELLYRRAVYAKKNSQERQEELSRRRSSYAKKKIGVLRDENDFAPSHDPSGNAGQSSPDGVPHDITMNQLRLKELNNKDGSSSHSGQLNINVLATSSDYQGTLVSGRRKRLVGRIIDNLPNEPWSLPSVDPCIYYLAARFHHEVPGFCCGEGQVLLAPRELVPELGSLLTGETESSKEFSLKEDPTVGSNLNLYFHETDGLIGSNGKRGAKLDPKLVIFLMDVLKLNPYARFFKSLRSFNHLADYTIVLCNTPDLDQRTFNLPTVSQVGAIWNEPDSSEHSITRDIKVYVNEDISHRVHYFYGCYDPLQYPLLFPRGEPGWHARIPKNKKHNRSGVDIPSRLQASDSNVLISPALVDSAEILLRNESEILEEHGRRGNGVSLRQYYCYLFQIRPNDKSYLLNFGRLLQQYVIDMYIKLETSRLDYYRSDQRQQDLRIDTYQGVMDSLSIDGQNNPNAIGRRFVLPSSFIGGPRDMRKRYVNAMALVQKYGKPDIFLTMTCNPAWTEITGLLLKTERPEDRPDLVARVFKSKLEELKNDIVRKKIFGDVAAYVYVVEFQKRGLPHVHWLVILKHSHKITSPDVYDSIISAELPQSGEHPFLRSYVIKHMLHGPCGTLNPSNVCMHDGKCKNHYPKPFSNVTHLGVNSYPNYRRRDNGDSVSVRHALLDNRWVVPYNPYLLAKYNCHINVEVCSDIKLVKYLYKYIYKGHDRVAYHIVEANSAHDHDEISHYQSSRWVAAPEAFWRIYGFSLSEMHPPVIVLQVHLENHHIIRFGRRQTLEAVMANPAFQRTMLIEFFKTNAIDAKARELNLLYKEFPEHYVWNYNSRTWKLRSRREVVGRLVTVHPCEGERFYKRLLLNNIRAPPSSKYLRTVNGREYPTFREAAFQLGLLDSDSYISDCLEEASLHEMPYSMQRLFATILVFCSPTNPRSLWNTFEPHLSLNFRDQTSLDQSAARRKTLESIHFILQSMGRSLGEFSLTSEPVRLTEEQKFSREYDLERSILVSPADLLAEGMLNSCQKVAFDAVVGALDNNCGGAFFVDGPGGSGKTFLYRALLAYVRSRGHIALSVATSGVAASLLPGGRTAHSRFKFPLEIDESTDSKVSKQSSLSRLIKSSKLIVWDEASMANKCVIESLDKLLRDVYDSSVVFGGKVVLFGGDFRQTLPIIVGGSRDDMVKASIVSSTLWPSIRKLNLSVNMRARDDPSFIDFLLRIGNGTHPYVVDDVIQLPSHLCIPFLNPEDSLRILIDYVFPSFDSYLDDPFSVVKRAILTPKNDTVSDINMQLINNFPGDPVEYLSFDKTDDPSQQSDNEDYLNSVCVAGLPPHKLVLKMNCPVMLLRNLDPAEGLCNGTRLIIRHLGPRLIAAEIAIGDYKGRHVFIPKIPLQASDRLRCPIPFKRHQFPLRLCFAMTINKAQGQTLNFVGVYLQEPVFSHGQLYVALSRARSSLDVKVLICPTVNAESVSVCRTKNVVYPEIFQFASA